MVEKIQHLEDAKSAELLKQGWHAVDREEAEKLLFTAPLGSYLFRKDHFANCLEEILVRAKKGPMSCYTMAYLDVDQQVREKTIVHWNDHWLFYDDDPSLMGRSFTSLEMLLLSLGTTLKKPLA